MVTSLTRVCPGMHHGYKETMLANFFFKFRNKKQYSVVFLEDVEQCVKLLSNVTHICLV